MYWDETFESWLAFDVVSQPAAVLLSPDGEVLERWSGMYDEGRVLELVAG
jgi:hypothetical protein